MNYDKTIQKTILKETEDDILAIIAVRPSDDTFEVIFANDPRQIFQSDSSGSDFFDLWKSDLLQHVYEGDRAYFSSEMNKENAARHMEEGVSQTIIVRLLVSERPAWYRIRMIPNVPEKGVCCISVRDVDYDINNLLKRESMIKDLESGLDAARSRIGTISRRMEKGIFINTFGTFSVFNMGKPVALSGKAKEILAFLVVRRGREVRNEELFHVLWEGRKCTSGKTTYHNAYRRLRQHLEKEGLGDLLIGLPSGKMVNISMFSCDLYDWIDGVNAPSEAYSGRFLEEYSWAESLKPHIAERKLPF